MILNYSQEALRMVLSVVLRALTLQANGKAFVCVHPMRNRFSGAELDIGYALRSVMRLSPGTLTRRETCEAQALYFSPRWPWLFEFRKVIHHTRARGRPPFLLPCGTE